MSSIPVTASAERPLSSGAVALMLMLCLSWGFNQIAVKLVLPDVPPMLQALSRSVGALPVLLVIGWVRGGVSLHRTVFRGAGLLFVSRRAAARIAMGRARLVLCRRRAGDRRA